MIAALLAVAQALGLLRQRVVVGAHLQVRALAPMPHSNTIDRAIAVARSRSLAAPLVIRPNTTCSAARPARITFSQSHSSSVDWR